MSHRRGLRIGALACAVAALVGCNAGSTGPSSAPAGGATAPTVTAASVWDSAQQHLRTASSVQMDITPLDDRDGLSCSGTAVLTTSGHAASGCLNCTQLGACPLDCTTPAACAEVLLSRPMCLGEPARLNGPVRTTHQGAPVDQITWAACAPGALNGELDVDPSTGRAIYLVLPGQTRLNSTGYTITNYR